MSTSHNSAQNRERKRDQVRAFFCAHIGESFPTAYLHARFGTAFRSGTSELNRDPACPITIHSHSERSLDGREASFYWGEWKFPQQPIFPEFFCDVAERHRDDG